MTTVSDLMTTDVVSLDASQDIVLATTVMNLRKIRHLPVTQGGKLVGLISHRDLLRAQARFLDQLEPSAGKKFASVLASDIMSGDVVTVTESTSAADAARMLLEHKFGCLPVVNGDTLVGIVTAEDFLRWAVDRLERDAE